MKKSVTILLLVVCTVISIVSFMAWVDNISITCQWYSSIGLEYKHTGTVTDEDIKNAEDEIRGVKYSGPFPSLDFLSVDLSTVSTFIPFFGFLLMAVGFLRILRKKDVSENFPFFRSYDRIMVSLGLIGTLWGIIMIGYYPQKYIQMSTLMICLHTALYSTLVAVVWVFIVAMAVRPSMQWWNRVVHGHILPQMEEDLLQVLDRLSISAANAGAGFDSANSQVTELTKSVSETKSEFREVLGTLKEFRERTGVDIFQAVENSCSEISTAIKGMNVESGRLKETMASVQETVVEMSKVIEKESKLLNELETRLKRIEQEKDEALAKTEKAVSEKITAEKNAEFAEKKQKEFESQLSKIKDALK